MGALPPWYILAGVKPLGKDKDMGTYSVVTFSKEQQDQFGINENGTVEDQTKFLKAVEAQNAKKKAPDGKKGVGAAKQQRKASAPWYITAGVKPLGKDKSMGSYSVVT